MLKATQVVFCKVNDQMEIWIGECLFNFFAKELKYFPCHRGCWLLSWSFMLDSRLFSRFQHHGFADLLQPCQRSVYALRFVSNAENRTRQCLCINYHTRKISGSSNLPFLFFYKIYVLLLWQCLSSARRYAVSENSCVAIFGSKRSLEKLRRYMEETSLASLLINSNEKSSASLPDKTPQMVFTTTTTTFTTTTTST